MKFNKKLKEYIQKYKDTIKDDKMWFNYKIAKKTINKILRTYPEFEGYILNPGSQEACCICLDNKDMMKTLCCKNYVHHRCLLHTIIYCNSSCPLCRQDIINTYFNRNVVRESMTDEQRFHIDVLSLLSTIHLNIMHTETVYNKIQNIKIRERYCAINYMAVIKIAKKIHKYLHIDVVDYYLQLMRKKDILHPQIGPKLNLLAMIRNYIKNDSL